MRCHWCEAPGTYQNCQHGEPPRECRVHGKWTDLNLITRGRRAVVKCRHYGQAWVVLYADPIADDKEYGTYSCQFAMVGVGQELYIIKARQHVCPHAVYARLVEDMLGGARPSENRVPDPTSRTAEPGKELPDAPV